MLRCYNWSFQTMLFLGTWDWKQLADCLPLALPLSLVAVFVPERYISKYYGNNTIFRLGLLTHYNLTFAMGLIDTTNNMRGAYESNFAMFFLGMLVAECYCTVMVETAEFLLFERHFPKTANILIIAYYLPSIIC
mmetsp:Transcript_22671/g.26031  ORF Transcript_22671/g.26031 Transcript_22671/m.26031 type:complete len:135 (+) Transcript_22671:198-602(+)